MQFYYFTNFIIFSTLQITNFDKECLEAWSDFKSCTPVIRQDILNENIWNNQNLLINKQLIFNKKIMEAGFVHWEICFQMTGS